MTLRSIRQAFDVVAVCVALALIWKGLSLFVGAATLPPPLATIRHLGVLLHEPRFLGDIAATGEAYLAALVLAMAGGLALGVACGGWRAVGEPLEPALLALIATPKVMFYPMILLLFGLGGSAKIFFGILHGMPPVVILTATALRGLRPIHRKTARTLRLSQRDFALHVLIPAIMPEIVRSFRVCFALTLLGVLVGEMFASTRGLGHLLFASIGTNDQPTILAITLLLFVFAGLGSSLLLLVSRQANSGEQMT